MAVRVQLNNFRFSIYIDADGTVTFTDLPPELREVVATLDPAHVWGSTCVVSPPLASTPLTEDDTAHQATPENLRRAGHHG
jgi:hypothetical protein